MKHLCTDYHCFSQLLLPERAMHKWHVNDFHCILFFSGEVLFCLCLIRGNQLHLKILMCGGVLWGNSSQAFDLCNLKCQQHVCLLKFSINLNRLLQRCCDTCGIKSRKDIIIARYSYKVFCTCYLWEAHFMLTLANYLFVGSVLYGLFFESYPIILPGHFEVKLFINSPRQSLFPPFRNYVQRGQPLHIGKLYFYLYGVKGTFSISYFNSSINQGIHELLCIYSITC
jgi:hypothetical protein